MNLYALRPALIEAPERVLSVYSVLPEKGGRLFSYPEYIQSYLVGPL